MAGPTKAFDRLIVLVIPIVVDTNVVVMFAVLITGVLIRRIPVSSIPFAIVKDDVRTVPYILASVVLI